MHHLVRLTMAALLGGTLCGAVLPLAAQSAASSTAKVLVNTKRGVALEGYDPISFFEGRPALGDAAISAVHETATYRFATEANRTRFLSDPSRYAPQYGGYCAYGMAKGYAAPVEIETAQIVEGRLMLNYDRSIQRKFNADRAALVRAADANWPGVVAKRGIPAPR